MSISIDSNAGTGGYNAEPNVVPMIDILLVLLIIFMMQVAVSRKTMDVQLPPKQEVQSDPNESSSSNQIVLELLADGTYAINSEALLLSQLDNKIHEIYDTRPAKLLFIKTAGNREYGDVVTAMDIARGAGVQVIGFTPPESKGEE